MKTKHMKLLKNFPIKTKLIVILFATSILSLIVCCSLFIYNGLKLIENNMLRNLNVLAGTVGYSSRSAIFFDDSESATKILSSFKEEPQIRFAALYDGNDKIFAVYKKDINSDFEQPSIKKDGHSILEGSVEILRPIMLRNKEIGAIYLKASMEEFEELLSDYIVLAGVIFLITLSISSALSIKLQSIISEPILSLAKTAREISKNQDYTVRVKHTNMDEVGILYSGFNGMLAQIQKRDEELVSYRSNLEATVDQRTQELSQSIEKLNSEAKERLQAEEGLKNSLEEKKILLKEIHHRVKNNLQLISSLLRLHYLNNKNQEYAHLFEDCANRVQSIAYVHEKLYESPSLAKIDFKDYLQKLVTSLIQSNATDTNLILINIETNKISLDINSGVPCGLIIQELVSNALKHAFPYGGKGEINIMLNVLDEGKKQLQLVVRDNGVGFPKGLYFHNTSSLGLKIVATLVEKQLKGVIELNQNEGTEFEIVFFAKGESDASKRFKDSYC